MSVLLAAYHNVNAQTLESITQEKSLEDTHIVVGNDPQDVQINIQTNKIYVGDKGPNTVSVIDGDSGNTKTIHVGQGPQSIAIDDIR